jgi:hypothetical protein
MSCFASHVTYATRYDLIGSFSLTELYDEETTSARFRVELFHYVGVLLYFHPTVLVRHNSEKLHFVF